MRMLRLDKGEALVIIGICEKRICLIAAFGGSIHYISWRC